MFTPGWTSRRVFCTLATALIISLPACGGTNHGPSGPAPAADPEAVTKKLEAGEIVVDCEELNGIKYVIGRIIIDETPERLWPVLVNPFEFEGKICHRMKRVDVISDQPQLSQLGCTVALVFPFPDLMYVVESKYTACSRVDFQRISGSFKDFRGFWELLPSDHGKKTEVVYSMYLDPGFPVPDWLVRQGVRGELPTVLSGLRTRVDALRNSDTVKEKRNIAAAMHESKATALVVQAAPVVSGPAH